MTSLPKVQQSASRATLLGIDDYLGHDIEPIVYTDSVAYATPDDGQLQIEENGIKQPSILIQDLILLTDFIGVPELVNLL